MAENQDKKSPAGKEKPSTDGIGSKNTNKPFSSGPAGPGRGSKKGTETPWGKPGTGSKSGLGSKGDTASEHEEIHRERKLVKKLGEGSFGEVWLVDYLGKLEVHKYLPAGTSRDAFREAINTRAVDHPHVVRVMDVIEEDGIPALWMEYVEGKDLHYLVEEEGIFSVERVLPLAIQITDALVVTHERGIVHLDLKPSNLILRRDNKNVVVTDFGISAAIHWKKGEWVGGKGGTPFFMAPELHKKGGTGSQGADIWSLGVSLYFLVSGTYPFPFDQVPPEEAVNEPPRELCSSHPYVSREFWKILRKMLTVDPDDRYPSMKAVKDDLEKVAKSLTCPDCGRAFRLQSIAGICPNPDCQSQIMVPLKSAVAAKHAAETALAECSFDVAEKEICRAIDELNKIMEYKPKIRDLSDFSAQMRDLKEEVDAFFRSLAGLKKDHDDSLASCRELMDREKLIVCVHRFHEARLRFSRSEEIRKLRNDLRRVLVQLHTTLPDKVEQRIRAIDFETADEYLRRIEHGLGDDLARRELRAGLESEPKDFAWLRERLEKQKKHYRSLQSKGREAIQAFDFKEALNIFTQLEGDFPSESNRDLLTGLRRGKDMFDRQAVLDDEALLGLISSPETARETPNLMLKDGLSACRQLLVDFPVEEYSAFDAFRVKSELIQQAIDKLRRFVDDCLAKARAAREGQNLREEHRFLDLVRNVVLGMDIFDEQTRSAVQERLRVSGRDADEAEKLYKEGKDALEAREYPKALAHLREVQRLAPGMYENLDTLLQQLETSLEEVRTAKDDLSKYLARLDQDEFSRAYDALKAGERFFRIANDSERKTWFSDIAAACVRIFDYYTGVIKTEAHLTPANKGIEVAAYLQRTLVSLTEIFPKDRWVTLVGISREFKRSLCQLIDAAGPKEKIDFDTLTRNFNPLLEVLESEALAAALRHCDPPRGIPHPSMQWAEILIETLSRESGKNRDLQFEAANEVLERLTLLCPENFKTSMASFKDDLKKRSRQATFLVQLDKIRGLAKTYLWIVLTGVVASLVFYFMGRSTGQESMLARLVSEGTSQTLGVPLQSLKDWIETSQTNEVLSQRIGALNACMMLDAALKQEDRLASNVDLEKLLGQSVFSRRFLLEMQKAQDSSQSPGEPGPLQILSNRLNQLMGEAAARILESMVQNHYLAVIEESPIEGGCIPHLISDLSHLEDLNVLAMSSRLRPNIKLFPTRVNQEVIDPLREDGWKQFTPEKIDALLSMDLNLPGPVLQGIQRILKIEL
ncbi:MAG: protein kinase, partial [Planctomycetota bacterium]